MFTFALFLDDITPKPFAFVFWLCKPARVGRFNSANCTALAIDLVQASTPCVVLQKGAGAKSGRTTTFSNLSGHAAKLKQVR